MINNYGQLGYLQQQSNNLMHNLIKLGLNQAQIAEMINNPNAVKLPEPIQNQSYVPPTTQAEQNVKQESETIAIQDDGLFLKMFSTFCVEKPEDAKEFSIALTKFARFVQSTLDKSSKPQI